MTKELLFSVTIKDCDIQTFTCGGKGGSGKDTSNNGVRLVHRDSGARGEARDSRNQLQNKRAAFRRLVESAQFKSWHRTETARRLGQLRDIDKNVDKAMLPQNLKVEINTEGGWVREGKNATEQTRKVD